MSRESGSELSHRGKGWTCLGQVERRRVASVVVIPVHVQHLLPIYREQTGEDALGEACALWRELGREVGVDCLTRTTTCCQLYPLQLDGTGLTSYSSSMAAEVICLLCLYV